MKFVVQWGCYLNRYAGQEIIDADSYDEAIQYAYEAAYQETESWVGMHGFADYDQDEFESEEHYAEQIHEDIENAAQYDAWQVADDFEFDGAWYEPEI
jgi:hypothetical protein